MGTCKFAGELTLSKSKLLNTELPKDDIVEWLFLVVGEHRFTFFYKINEPSMAVYGLPFHAKMSFIMDTVDQYIEIDRVYDIWRGEEPVGTVKILEKLHD